jgi:hypothetical protein
MLLSPAVRAGFAQAPSAATGTGDRLGAFLHAEAAVSAAAHVVSVGVADHTAVVAGGGSRESAGFLGAR